MANQYTPFRFMSDTHKECSLCNKIKEHSEFHKDKNNKRCKGLAYYCKECANQKTKSFHKANENNLEYKLNKKSHHIKTKYGITYSEYILKMETQKFCGICNEKLDGIGNTVHLDHDHKTNKLRDFLCSHCNRGLGCFFDSTDKLNLAIKYLEKHKEK